DAVQPAVPKHCRRCARLWLLIDSPTLPFLTAHFKNIGEIGAEPVGQLKRCFVVRIASDLEKLKTRSIRDDFLSHQMDGVAPEYDLSGDHEIRVGEVGSQKLV